MQRNPYRISQYGNLLVTVSSAVVNVTTSSSPGPNGSGEWLEVFVEMAGQRVQNVTWQEHIPTNTVADRIGVPATPRRTVQSSTLDRKVIIRWGSAIIMSTTDRDSPQQVILYSTWMPSEQNCQRRS